MFELIAGVVYVLALTALSVFSSSPPVGESYQLNVPDDAADADSVAVVAPQVDPLVTVMDSDDEIVAATVARAVVQVPLSNST